MSCIIHQMMSCTESRVKPAHELMQEVMNTPKETKVYSMSLLGTLWLCRLMTLACHSKHTSSTGGKTKLTNALGMSTMRKNITMKVTTMSGA